LLVTGQPKYTATIVEQSWQGIHFHFRGEVVKEKDPSNSSKWWYPCDHVKGLVRNGVTDFTRIMRLIHLRKRTKLVESNDYPYQFLRYDEEVRDKADDESTARTILGIMQTIIADANSLLQATEEPIERSSEGLATHFADVATSVEESDEQEKKQDDGGKDLSMYEEKDERGSSGWTDKNLYSVSDSTSSVTVSVTTSTSSSSLSTTTTTSVCGPGPLTLSTFTETKKAVKGSIPTKKRAKPASPVSPGPHQLKHLKHAKGDDEDPKEAKKKE
jgi:hypothetical protein